MNIQYYSKNVDLNDQTKNYIQKKCQFLDKFKNQITSCHWDLSQDNHHRKGKVYRAEINLNIKGNKLLRAEESSSDLLSAVDVAKDKVKNQLIKYKDKRISDRRK